MKFTQDHALPCPEGEDYAATALYMQCLGEQVDAELTSRQDAFTGFLDRPAAAWIATAVITDIANGDEITPGAVGWSANWPVPITTTPRLPPVRGWYYVGANVTVAADGAPTANSLRKLGLRVVSAEVSLPNPGLFFDSIHEAQVGNNESLMVAGTVFYPGPSSPTVTATPVLVCEIQHGDPLDLMTTVTPPFTVWVAFLGDAPQIAPPPQIEAS